MQTLRRYGFETYDVFTERRFGGNQLAVVADAAGLSDGEMQAIAQEFNLSETIFVLPPADPANTARVRIFNRTAEMPFAGHPTIGAAMALARHWPGVGEAVRLEAPAGVVAVRITRDAVGRPKSARVACPQPLSLGEEIAPEVIARCVGLATEDIVCDVHRPVVASVGTQFVLAQVGEAALGRCRLDVAAFEAAAAQRPHLRGRFSLHLYARDGQNLHARMFAPLARTFEDPATGSANGPLAALLLKLSGGVAASFRVRQGEEMGRPSFLTAHARREGEALWADVEGTCVCVMRGTLELDGPGEQGRSGGLGLI
jgi:trans-2,3-dihydro-3-hydroxyanthranilate isomerase